MNKVLAGLQIIAKYDEDFELCAEHDEVFAGHGVEMNEEDQKVMDDLGWSWDGESWHKFT